MEKIYKFDFNGCPATVVVPDNANGEWVWKTEFFHAFDMAERDLFDRGYTRVYYKLSDRYGSYGAVRMMHLFYLHVVHEFGLRDKCHLFGFSRGGLYAFNFCLSYPEYVASLYLDAPVLDMKSWPPKGSEEQMQLFEEYTLSEDTLSLFRDNPVDNLSEFFALDIPLMLVAGDADELVPLEENGGVLLDYCEKNGIAVVSIVKKGCGHHPHSLEDTAPIIEFIKKHSVC